MGTEIRIVLVCASTVALATVAAAQVDDRMARVNVGASPRVYAIDIAPDNTVGLTGPSEVRQERPPHHYAVLVENRSAQPLGAVTVTMAVAVSEGSVRAFQDLPAIKNLKPGQARRQEARVRGVVHSPTDRIAFVLRSLLRDGGPWWQATEEELRRVVREGAKRVPVP